MSGLPQQRNPPSDYTPPIHLVVFGVDVCPVSQEFFHRGRLARIGGYVEGRVTSVITTVCRCAIILKEESVVHHTYINTYGTRIE